MRPLQHLRVMVEAAKEKRIVFELGLLGRKNVQYTTEHIF